MQPDPAHKSTMPAGWSRLLALITAATLGAQAVAAPVTFDFSGLDGTFGKQLTVTDAGSGIAATLTAVFNLVEVQFDAPGGMIVNRNNRLVQVPQTINAVTGKGLGIGTDHPALPGGNPLADGSTGFSLGGTLLTVTTEAFLLTFSGSDVNRRSGGRANFRVDRWPVRARFSALARTGERQHRWPLPPGRSQRLELAVSYRRPGSRADSFDPADRIGCTVGGSLTAYVAVDRRPQLTRGCRNQRRLPYAR